MRNKKKIFDAINNANFYSIIKHDPSRARVYYRKALDILSEEVTAETLDQKGIDREACLRYKYLNSAYCAEMESEIEETFEKKREQQTAPPSLPEAKTRKRKLTSSDETTAVPPAKKAKTDADSTQSHITITASLSVTISASLNENTPNPSPATGVTTTTPTPTREMRNSEKTPITDDAFFEKIKFFEKLNFKRTGTGNNGRRIHYYHNLEIDNRKTLTNDDFKNLRCKLERGSNLKEELLKILGSPPTNLNPNDVPYHANSVPHHENYFLSVLLLHACEWENTAAILPLLSYGANLFYWGSFKDDSEYKNYIAHLSAYYGKTKTLKAIMASMQKNPHALDINLQDTILTSAIKGLQPEAVKLILDEIPTLANYYCDGWSDLPRLRPPTPTPLQLIQQMKAQMRGSPVRERLLQQIEKLVSDKLNEESISLQVSVSSDATNTNRCVVSYSRISR